MKNNSTQRILVRIYLFSLLCMFSLLISILSCLEHSTSGLQGTCRSQLDILNNAFLHILWPNFQFQRHKECTALAGDNQQIELHKLSFYTSSLFFYVSSIPILSLLSLMYVLPMFFFLCVLGGKDTRTWEPRKGVEPLSLSGTIRALPRARSIVVTPRRAQFNSRSVSLTPIMYHAGPPLSRAILSQNVTRGTSR